MLSLDPLSSLSQILNYTHIFVENLISPPFSNSHTYKANRLFSVPPPHVTILKHLLNYFYFSQQPDQING